MTAPACCRCPSTAPRHPHPAPSRATPSAIRPRRRPAPPATSPPLAGTHRSGDDRHGHRRAGRRLQRRCLHARDRDLTAPSIGGMTRRGETERVPLVLTLPRTAHRVARATLPRRRTRLWSGRRKTPPPTPPRRGGEGLSPARLCTGRILVVARAVRRHRAPPLPRSCRIRRVSPNGQGIGRGGRPCLAHAKKPLSISARRRAMGRGWGGVLRRLHDVYERRARRSGCRC